MNIWMTAGWLVGISLAAVSGYVLGHKQGHAKGLQAPTFRKVVAVPDTENVPRPTIRSADIRRAAGSNWTRVSGPGNIREGE